MADGDDGGYIHADLPTSLREQRACMTCSLVKTFSQFYDSGCDNCPFLQMAENRQRVSECTTAYFEGIIGMMQPKESWVAKWQKLVRLIPGVYAVTVSGQLPDSIKSFLDERGIPYKAN